MSRERDHDRPRPLPAFDPPLPASEPNPDRIRREHPSPDPSEPRDPLPHPSRRLVRALQSEPRCACARDSPRRERDCVPMRPAASLGAPSAIPGSSMSSALRAVGFVDLARALELRDEVLGARMLHHRPAIRRLPSM